MPVTPSQLAAWRQTLLHVASPFGDPDPVEEIAARLLLEVERLQGLSLQQAAALEKRLADLSVWGGECPNCHNAEARVAVAKLRKGTVG